MIHDSSSISLRFSWFSLSLHIDFILNLIGRIGLISKYHMSRRKENCFPRRWSKCSCQISPCASLAQIAPHSQSWKINWQRRWILDQLGIVLGQGMKTVYWGTWAELGRGQESISKQGSISKENKEVMTRVKHEQWRHSPYLVELTHCKSKQ